MKTFVKKDGKTISIVCTELYNFVSNYFGKMNLENSKKALSLAIKLHENTFRDGGEPYIVHPLRITQYLILLNLKNAIFDTNKSKLRNDNLAEEQTLKDLDVLFSVSLLHDVIEDCLKNGYDLVTNYGFPEEVYINVKTLSKDKSDLSFSAEKYFENISNSWITTLVKLADRTDNCSSMDIFNDKRRMKYLSETKEHFFPLCSKAKVKYPKFSRTITIMDYLIVSLCETLASAMNLPEFISETNPEKTYNFLKGFFIGRDDVDNSIMALSLSKKYYNGLKRKSGDPFIIHPLRVCSYLVSLKVNDDKICSAALLHEIINVCNAPFNGIEIVTKYDIDPIVLDYIRAVSNSENYPKDIYYESLKHSLPVLLIKLSNRANTCTKLIGYSDKEIDEYISECTQYIYPLCDYAKTHYPEYAYSIELMEYHISSVCTMVQHLKSEES